MSFKGCRLGGFQFHNTLVSTVFHRQRLMDHASQVSWPILGNGELTHFNNCVIALMWVKMNTASAKSCHFSSRNGEWSHWLIVAWHTDRSKLMSSLSVEKLEGNLWEEGLPPVASQHSLLKHTYEIFVDTMSTVSFSFNYIACSYIHYSGQFCLFSHL